VAGFVRGYYDEAQDFPDSYDPDLEFRPLPVGQRVLLDDGRHQRMLTIAEAPRSRQGNYWMSDGSGSDPIPFPQSTVLAGELVPDFSDAEALDEWLES
jgi:hypothetical protein